MFDAVTLPTSVRKKVHFAEAVGHELKQSVVSKTRRVRCLRSHKAHEILIFCSPNSSLYSRCVVPAAPASLAAHLLQLIYLNNIPLVTGACYVKWHLPSSTAAEHQGKTPRAPIKDHLVTWDYEQRLEVRLIVDKHGQLESSPIEFKVVQEYAVGAKSERSMLGVVRLNLAEYVLACDEAEGEICRRYLMQESKINSTLRVRAEVQPGSGRC